MKLIYFDNGASTAVAPEVVKSMQPYFEERFGNASSQHEKGREAKEALEKSRKKIAKSIGAKTNEVYFTSGGTESNNWALKGLFWQNQKQGTGKNHIVTTKIEHDCVLNSCKWLETQGAKVTYLDVDKKGFIDLNDLKNAITEKTFVVSVIHGNNEIGTIQDLEAISKICKEKNVLLHTDACQSYTKTFLDIKKQGLDLVTLNSHKIHGPKGVGALYVRQGVKITPFMHGGGHEAGLRSGTENISGIVGFAKASEVIDKKAIKKMTEIRNKLIKGILEIENVILNGAKNSEDWKKDKRLCNNVNISFNNIEGESLGGYLMQKNICTSTGSACMAHSLEPSHVLTAIGLTPLQANSSLRITISKYTTEEEVDYFLKVLPEIVRKLRRISAI